ncbi:helix-turn-helix transcriptional regulator [Flavobacterium sp. UMI-01]|uniref:AraC family transcriptional regulator n=1 Tax=Flavobacterium sp. UMI-01 TaxID=1441053 RepID=UPI001C7D4F14|nr:helix-turn-helix transcriptional regulator [Flavobacterium sp. UMI-01]GIZ07308.1 AraC family transcriptional regulator [Flavobacterium sp. UMI-01]
MKKSIAVYTKIPNVTDIKIEPFDVNKRYTKPHRHDKYIELVYFKAGSGCHYMDTTAYEIQPPIVFVINKNEVHHWEITTVPEGFVIIVKEAFLEKTIDKHINQQLYRLSKEPVIPIQSDESIDKLFEVLCVEMKQASVQKEVIEGSLKALFAKIIGYSNRAERPVSNDKSIHFETLLKQELRNEVAFYADLLHLTTQQLNTLCKKNFSKTASQVIANYIIQEAKRQLLYTDRTISEIAYSLDFKDVSHFVKYFKRHTGSTPLNFKQMELNLSDKMF